MGRYFLRRLIYVVPAAAGVMVVAFLVVHLVPGDPVQKMLGIHATPRNIAILRHQLGLDKPLMVQLATFGWSALSGNFGDSYWNHTAVRGLVAGRVMVTLWLALYALVLSLLVSVPLAMWSALRHNRLPDHIIRFVSVVMFSMPAFWIGLLLANEFSLRLHWFPVSGYEGGPRGILRSLTLPAITIALFLGPILLRTLRASLVEVMGAEFIEAARARGFGETRVISRHAMRNALISTITVIGANVGFLISGTVIVEEVYGLPGLGSLLVGSILHRDYLLIQTMVLLFGFVVILANLLTDLAYALVDPRVRLGARVT